MIDKLKAKFREGILDQTWLTDNKAQYAEIIVRNIDRLLEGAKVVYHGGPGMGWKPDPADTHASLVLFNEPLVVEDVSVKRDMGKVQFFTDEEIILLRKLIAHDNKEPAEDQRVTVEEIITPLEEFAYGTQWGKELVARLKKHGIK